MHIPFCNTSDFNLFFLDLKHRQKDKQSILSNLYSEKAVCLKANATQTSSGQIISFLFFPEDVPGCVKIEMDFIRVLSRGGNYVQYLKLANVQQGAGRVPSCQQVSRFILGKEYVW